MFKNYLNVAFRNLLRNKIHSIINISGLAIALTCCILIFLFVQDELTFDSFHSKAERIFRIVETRKEEDNSVRKFPFTAGPLSSALKQDFAVVENTIRVFPREVSGRFTIEYKGSKFYEGEHIFSEQQFFDFFDFEFRSGSKYSALAEPNSVVLTEQAALKYFGNEDPFGKVLNVEDLGDVKVTGIINTLPGNSHLNFSMIFSFSTLMANEGFKKYVNNWKSDGFITYVLLKEGANYKQLESGLNNFNKKHRGNDIAEIKQIYLQSLKDIHFHSADIEDDLNYDAGNIEYVYIFSAAAVFILLIACINFVNLTTAKSSRRAKEVGMRKVMGAFRFNLIKQFLGESVIVTLFALLLSVLLVELLLPSFNEAAGKNITNEYLTNIGLFAALFLILLIISIFSGSYPALILSRFQPTEVLKGNYKSNFKTPVLRKALIVIQFALSVIIITSTVIVYNQLDYIQNKPMGFNKDHKVIVDINSGDTRKNFIAIKNEFLKNSNVISTATSSRVPGDWKDIFQTDVIPEEALTGKGTLMYFMGFDEDMLDTYDFKLLNGRNFSAGMGTDSSALLINETAAKVLGWKDPIGKKISIPEGKFSGRVIGVIRDFHFQSLHKKIEPVVIANWQNPVERIDYFTVKIKAAGVASTLTYLQSVHEQFDKLTPFEYNFLDERINDFYQKDMRTGKLFGAAAVIAIILACLGLLGLSSYSAELRTKEIGIRKVLGASIPGIVRLLSKEFIILVAVSNIIAWPVAYWFMNNWLQDFAYRINIEFYTFILTGLTALFIAVLTIAFQAIKAAASNPVKSLKYE